MSGGRRAPCHDSGSGPVGEAAVTQVRRERGERCDSRGDATGEGEWRGGMDGRGRTSRRRAESGRARARSATQQADPWEGEGARSEYNHRTADAAAQRLRSDVSPGGGCHDGEAVAAPPCRRRQSALRGPEMEIESQAAAPGRGRHGRPLAPLLPCPRGKSASAGRPRAATFWNASIQLKPAPIARPVHPKTPCHNARSRSYAKRCTGPR